MVEIENASYKRYVLGQRETENMERRHEIVKKLLQRLPESERTVVTLYYLGEMTAKEIGKFLGVSVNTINSRLRRAKKRLQEQEERLIQEVLGSVQMPVSFIENIGRQIVNIKPMPSPPVAKPLLPWAALGTTAILIVLGLGVSNQCLIRLAKASELYTELRSTDGTTRVSPQIAAWRDETWQEVKRLFQDVAYTGKIMRYRSYLRVVGVEKDPILPGGWIYALTEPLPMRVSVSRSVTPNEPAQQESAKNSQNEN